MHTGCRRYQVIFHCRRFSDTDTALLSDTCGVCCGGSDRSRKDRLQKVTVGYAIGTKTFMHFSTAILIGYFIVVWGGVLHKLDVAFCDTNETYGERFAAYLMEHKAKEFTVHLFPEPELFLQKIKNEKFDLVLLGSGFSEFGEQAVLSGMTVLILSENIPERLSEDNSYLQSGRKLTVIFKYQPMEAILHEMMVVTGGKKRERNHLQTD